VLDSVKILTNVCGINLFDQSDVPAVVRQDMANDLYFRLWQSDRKERFVPAYGATLTITFPRSYSVGSSSSTAPAADQSFVVSASSPFVDTITSSPNGDTVIVPQDRSLWKVSLTQQQSNLVAGGGVLMTLTEGAKVTKIFLPSVIQKLPSSGV